MNEVSPLAASTGFVEDYAVVAGRFAERVGSTDLRAPVAACPGWTTYDLVTHLGNVHAWAATIVETGQPAAKQHDEPRSSRSRAVRDWYVGKAEDLFQVLRQTPPTQPCWNFAVGQGTALFWQRRQVHETAVHLMDLDLAAGRPWEVSSLVAADGVDEVLTVMLPRRHREGHLAALSAALRITASDTGDAWLVSPARPQPRLVPDQPVGPEASSAARAAAVPAPVVRRLRRAEDAAHLNGVPASGGGKHRADGHPDAATSEEDAVSAPAEVLYRALWHRDVDRRALEVHGDADRVARFLASPLVP